MGVTVSPKNKDNVITYQIKDGYNEQGTYSDDCQREPQQRHRFHLFGDSTKPAQERPPLRAALLETKSLGFSNILIHGRNLFKDKISFPCRRV